MSSGGVWEGTPAQSKTQTVKILDFDHLRVNSSKNTRAMAKKAPCTLACTATLAESKPEPSSSKH